MKRTLALFSLVVAAAVPGRSQEGVRFEPGCELPFAEIAVEREIDGVCGPRGSARVYRRQLQNEVKNNFCASGEPVLLLNRDFKALQRRIAQYRIPNGVGNEPRDRRPLAVGIHTVGETPVGEGMVVQHAAWIGSAEYLGADRYENVNCNRQPSSWKDIHLELGEKVDSRVRERISTEISPHFRPDSWSPEVLQKVKALGLPVRVTGQLFFDGSHKIANDRASNWEIHPVYRIEVCNSQDLASCRAEVEGMVWTDLHEWVEEQ